MSHQVPLAFNNSADADMFDALFSTTPPVTKSLPVFATKPEPQIEAVEAEFAFAL